MEVARAGIEPATPRFSGASNVLWLSRFRVARRQSNRSEPLPTAAAPQSLSRDCPAPGLIAQPIALKPHVREDGCVTRRLGRRTALLLLPLLTLAGALLAFVLAGNGPAQSTSSSTTTSTTTSTTASTATLSHIKLTVTPTDANRTLDFDRARNQLSITFHFKADPPLTDDRKVAWVPTDLVAGGKSIDASKITAAPGQPTESGRTLTLKLVVDPKDASPGTYKSAIEMEGKELETAKAGVLAAILDGLSWGEGIAAFFVILISAYAGAGVKYLSETAGKRGSLRRKLATIDQMVGRLGEANFALGFHERVNRARQQLRDGQTVEAQTTINAIWEKMDGLEDVATVARGERELLTSQIAAISQVHASTEVKSQLSDVVREREETLLRQDIDKAWATSADAAKTDLQKHDGWFNGFSTFLTVNASRPAADWNKANLKEIVKLYQAGDFERAEAKWKDEPPSSAVARQAGKRDRRPAGRAGRGRAFGASPTTVGSLQSWLKERKEDRRRRRGHRPEVRGRGVRDYIDDHADLLLWVISPILVSVAGLFLVWMPDEGFTSDDPKDWAKLAVWGLAGQISGTTVAQAFGVGRQPEPAPA
jgi:hypothetical protein